MTEFDEINLLDSKELEHLVQKYRERNPVSRILVKNFYYCIEKVVSALGPADRVLEVGCGAGLSSLRIRRMLQGRHFEISDVDDNVIGQFEKLDFPIPFQQESVLDLKRRNKEFDCVLFLEVLEHVPDYNRALSELFRVSKKYVVVSTPNEPLWRFMNMLRGKYITSFGNTPGHVNHWSKSSLVKLIGRYGKIVAVHNPLPWTIVVAEVTSDT